MYIYYIYRENSSEKLEKNNDTNIKIHKGHRKCRSITVQGISSLANTGTLNSKGSSKNLNKIQQKSVETAKVYIYIY